MIIGLEWTKSEIVVQGGGLNVTYLITLDCFWLFREPTSAMSRGQTTVIKCGVSKIFLSVAKAEDRL